MKVVNKLQHIEAFRAVLKNYHPSEANIQILRDTSIIFMVGPTAAGRNTLINLLVDTGRYHYVVSNTTRKPRENNGVMEQNGVEYWFKTEEEFLEELHDGKYLEAAIIHEQQVSGISMAELAAAKGQGKIAVDEIEVEGAKHIKEYKEDALFVFLLPPTFDVWMERLHSRGSMDEMEMRRRLQSASEEIAAALEADFYKFVINYEVHAAAQVVDELAHGHELDAEVQLTGRNHAEQLLIDIRLYLTSQTD